MPGAHAPVLPAHLPHLSLTELPALMWRYIAPLSAQLLSPLWWQVAKPPCTLTHAFLNLRR